jgi:hypothetical protein
MKEVETNPKGPGKYNSASLLTDETSTCSVSSTLGIGSLKRIIWLFLWAMGQCSNSHEFSYRSMEGSDSGRNNSNSLLSVTLYK